MILCYETMHRSAPSIGAEVGAFALVVISLRDTDREKLVGAFLMERRRRGNGVWTAARSARSRRSRSSAPSGAASPTTSRRFSADRSVHDSRALRPRQRRRRACSTTSAIAAATLGAQRVMMSP